MNDQAQRLREIARGQNKPIRIADELIGHIENKQPKTIAVTSGKGGVGKTNIALFLSVALSSLGKKVLLLDADLGLANVHILLGMAPKHDISHLVQGACTVNDIICTGPANIHLIPGASGFEQLATIDMGRLNLLIRQFAEIESNYDFIIIDTGAGIGQNVIQFAAHTDMPFLVLTPEPTSLADAYATVKVLYERGITHIGVVVNMALSDRDGMETFDRLNTIVVKFLKKPLEYFGVLPFDKELSRYVRRQRVLILDNPAHQISARMSMIARRISGIPQRSRSSFFARLWRKA